MRIRRATIFRERQDWKFTRIFFAIFFVISVQTYAQEELLKELDANHDETEVTIATFKGTRIINGHSIEVTPGGTLEFIFSHRFGRINSGWYEMFGLDQAEVRIGLDYGISDKLSVSLGRNSMNKTLDGFLKYKMMSQQNGVRTIPITITALGGVAFSLEPRRNADVSPDFKTMDRVAYTAQFLLARKVTSALSLQLMPTLIHKNAVDQTIEKNAQFAMGIGGRIKLTASTAFTSEYYYNFSRMENSPYYNAVGFGFDIETGGHVFQLVFTNAIGLTERAFVTETRDKFFDGDIHFGFNVTRTFQLKKDK
jgi:hypothetical protein